MGELVNKHARKVIQVDPVRYDEGGMNLMIPSSKTSPGVDIARGRCLLGQMGQHLPTQSWVSGLLGTVFRACGMNIQRYKGHSFRIGAASEAAHRGFSDAQIRLMGRWKSDALKKYTHLPF